KRAFVSFGLQKKENSFFLDSGFIREIGVLMTFPAHSRGGPIHFFLDEKVNMPRLFAETMRTFKKQ
ncbi:hypothetical protein, partial [Daejeonella sp.]|uniref:hypothetical protein n=1 Tax=Daejeonella sp. TaxID=2805397 RepID=UPI003784FB98